VDGDVWASRHVVLTLVNFAASFAAAMGCDSGTGERS